MAFPHDELGAHEQILLDTNPTFNRLLWPLLELMAITGVCWLLVGLIDGPHLAAGEFGVLRTLVMLIWLALIGLRVVRPVLAWLGERLVITQHRILLRRGFFSPRVVAIDLRSIRAVDRRGSVVYLHTHPNAAPLALMDVPGSKKVARLVSRIS